MGERYFKEYPGESSGRTKGGETFKISIKKMRRYLARTAAITHTTLSRISRKRSRKGKKRKGNRKIKAQRGGKMESLGPSPLCVRLPEMRVLRAGGTSKAHE